MTDDVDALIAENQRLRREVRDLRERVRAFETSRWYRVHPRRLTGRRQSSPAAEGAAANALSDDHTEPLVEPNVMRFREEVVARGAFSQDWLTEHVGAWEPTFQILEGRQARILEIGSYEGLSACFLLWRLPDAAVTCIDTFGGSVELESIFDANVASVDASRISKMVGDSRKVLLDLMAEDPRFDLIYVDGSHLGLDVLVDASLSWQLLKPGGSLIFDDYRYRDRGDDALLRPGPAIDAFLALIEGKHEQLFRGHQLGVRKSDLRSRTH